jgi:hypothetical protein
MPRWEPWWIAAVSIRRPLVLGIGRVEVGIREVADRAVT